ncbi:hypothetical protein [Bacteroides clarus]|uniref:hypothetical protein n=1 Tax=Bacteroides clarus TaxID=626929 RepID=UPI00267662BE|nr:hypothetical protein [Bacteroides clarus]
MDENENLMMKHMLRLVEAYNQIINEMASLRREMEELKNGSSKEKKVYRMKILKSQVGGS